MQQIMSRRFLLTFTVLFGCLLLLYGCRHDALIPLSNAPIMSFKNDIQPIMISNCTQSGCHGSSGHRFKLITYNDVLSIVKAGDPHSSELYSSITANTLNTMPQPPNPRLSDTQIKTIYVWILQGAKNN